MVWWKPVYNKLFYKHSHKFSVNKHWRETNYMNAVSMEAAQLYNVQSSPIV